MSNYVLIPLTNDPNQNFTVTIPIDGENRTLTLNINYNSIASYWTMSVVDKKTDTLLISSVPLITGSYPAADLFLQYKYLGLGSAIILKTGTLLMDYPDNTNLGTDFVLAWGDS